MAGQPKLKTRDRIALVSLDLFNLEGEPNVTTVDIANELDISPGNLYYHYKGKDLIIEQLYDRFEERITRVLRAPLDESLKPEDSWFYLYVLFEEIYAFRFLYRNLTDILQRIEAVGKRFKRLMNLKLSVANKMCIDLRHEGYLDASDMEVDSLARTIVMTMTFWLNYSDLLADTEDTALCIHEGVYQIMASVAPFLVKKSHQELHEDYQTFIEMLNNREPSSGIQPS